MPQPSTQTKFLAFWRELNENMRTRGAQGADLRIADILWSAGYSPAEATSVLAPTIWQANIDAGLPYGWEGAYND